MSETKAAGSAYPNLFSPLDVGPMKLRNRIAETTNTIGAGAMPGFVDDAYIAHHASKARGGTGWIGGETFLLDSPLPGAAADEFMPGVGSFRIPIYMMPGFVENVARFCDAVHETGSVVVCQLTYLNFTLAASPVPVADVYDWIPHEMDAREIQHCIAAYAAAAEKFMEAGVDGIELHCAHETTPHAFLSPATNKRTDEWGGGTEARTKFVREALLAVKARIGDRMALGVRVNGCESREGGYDADEFIAMMRCIGGTQALDFVNVDVGHSWGSPAYVQPSYYGAAEHREIGRSLKQALPGVAVLYAGRVNTPEVGEEMIAGGFADVVGMTRAGIADPEFANKAQSGRATEIRRCIGCNRCIGQSIRNDAPDAFKKPVCSVNPEIGNELLFSLTNKPADEKKRLVVVGGGPAGLEAARVAATRGHDVVLLESAPAPRRRAEPRIAHARPRELRGLHRLPGGRARAARRRRASRDRGERGRAAGARAGRDRVRDRRAAAAARYAGRRRAARLPGAARAGRPRHAGPARPARGARVPGGPLRDGLDRRLHRQRR